MVYPDDFDDIPIGAYESLGDPERIAYCVYWLEAEVNNGGFHQFFGNSSGAYTPNTLEALKVIGAMRTSEILQNAIRIAYPDGFPEDSSLHEDELRYDDAALSRLNDLDEQFYRYEDNLTGLVNKYLKGGS